MNTAAATTATATGGTTTSTATNVRTWAGHRQAFPLGQSHTPLTSMPTLGRALTDGSLTEVGFVNSFLQHLAQQSGPDREDDSDEDAKYEEEDEEAAREYEDDEDYYARNKKRRSRWRANYPKIKKPKRPTGDGGGGPSASSSASRRRASVSVTASNYGGGSGSGSGSGMMRREQRSNSVSSYFAMRNNEANNNMNVNVNENSNGSSSPTLPSPSSAFGADYVDSRLCSPPDHHQQPLPAPRSSYSHGGRPDLGLPEWMAAPSLPSGGGGGGPDHDELPAVPSPPPLYPVGLPSIQPFYPPPPQHHHHHHHHLQRSASSPAVLPPSYSFSSPARLANANEPYYSPQHHYSTMPQPQPQPPQPSSASAWIMPPPAPVSVTTNVAAAAMGDEDDEVLESSSISTGSTGMQQHRPLDYMAVAGPPTDDDEGSWLEDLLRMEQPSSAADSSSFPSTPLSPAHATHHHSVHGQHQPTSSAKDAFYAELFGF